MAHQLALALEPVSPRQAIRDVLAEESRFCDLVRSAAERPGDGERRTRAVEAIGRRAEKDGHLPVERRKAEARVALVTPEGRLKVILSDQEVRDARLLAEKGRGARFVVEFSHMASGCVFKRKGDPREPSPLSFLVANNLDALREGKGTGARRGAALISGRVFLDVETLGRNADRTVNPEAMLSSLRCAMSASRTRAVIAQRDRMLRSSGIER